MTYLQFHLLFTLPLMVVLAAVALGVVRRGGTLAGALGRRSNRFAAGALGVHLLIALVYTTPWDNFLVASGVWGYPEGRVLLSIGYVPLEEYLFFLIQTLLSGLFLYFLARRSGPERGTRESGRGGLVRLAGAGLGLLLAGAGLVAFRFPEGTYLGLILLWACPVLALQWGFGGDLLLHRWRILVPAVLLPSLYLWVADRIAIAAGIWWISPDLTTGVGLLGLPLEEALFFLATNLMVVFGLTLALHPESLPRLRRLRLKWTSWWRAVLILWALSMVPTPLFPEAFPVLAYLSTSLLAAGVLGAALARYGPRALLLFAIAFGFGVGVEWLGSQTGLPFGRYRYTAPGPSVAGVPLLVPLGWWAFGLVAVSVGAGRWVGWLAPLALVTWDLGLDPLMVAEGFWTFDPPGWFYGVPWSNFIGWYLAGLVLVALLRRLEPRLGRAADPTLLWVFPVQAFLIAVGLAFLGLPGAGLTCAVAMGIVLVVGRVLRPPTPLRRAGVDRGV